MFSFLPFIVDLTFGKIWVYIYEKSPSKAAKKKNSLAHMQKIPFPQISRWVPFKTYIANDLEKTLVITLILNYKPKKLHISKLNWASFIWHQLSSFITTLWDSVNYRFIQLVDLKNWPGCIPGYQARKGLHTEGQ